MHLVLGPRSSARRTASNGCLAIVGAPACVLHEISVVVVLAPVRNGDDSQQRRRQKHRTGGSVRTLRIRDAQREGVGGAAVHLRAQLISGLAVKRETAAAAQTVIIDLPVLAVVRDVAARSDVVEIGARLAR